MDIRLDRPSLISWLEEERPDRLAELYEAAYNTKLSTVGDKVYLRGLVEISNICRKNCLYCGIRRDNRNTGRYEISVENVLDAAEFAFRGGYGSLVIQGGERMDEVAAAIALALSDAGNDGETAAAIAVALDLYLDGGVHDQEPGFITIRSEEGSAWGQKQFNFRKNPKQ